MAPRPLNELMSSGVLWAVNRHVFHPRGLGLALVINDAGQVTGWDIQGDGSECFAFTTEDDDTKFTARNTFLASIPRPLVHYGSNGYGECGAGNEDDPAIRGKANVTLDTARVTCHTCRGWLPIVAPPKETPAP